MTISDEELSRDIGVVNRGPLAAQPNRQNASDRKKIASEGFMESGSQ